MLFSVNGERHWQSLYKLNQEQISEWMDFYKNSSGKEYLVQTKYEYTENPSIQGAWHPFVNADPEIAVAKFPMVKMFTKYFAVQNYAILTFFSQIFNNLEPQSLHQNT